MSDVVNYAEYVGIQKNIVDALNSYLPTLTDFSCDYVEVQQLTSNTPCLAIVFVPEAYEYMQDMTGKFRQVSFQLNYKQYAASNEEKLKAMSDLEYLAEKLETLNILTGNDKIVLEVKGSISPSVIQYDDGGETFVFQAIYTIDYKQMRR
ncbi:MAG: hypothetical protein ACRDD7_07265 [Peptostreptococcaceae bacterium]